MGYDYRIGAVTASIRVRGDYDTSAPGVDDYISDAFILDAVSEGYKEGYEILQQADPDRLTVVSSSLVSSPISSISLPSDMFRLRSIDIVTGGTPYRCTRDDPSPLNPSWDDTTTGTPMFHAGPYGLNAVYRLEGNTVYFRQRVPANSRIKFTYVPAPESITGPDQVIDGTAGLHEYIINFALIQCRDREDKETISFEKKLEKAKQRMVDMGSNRDYGQGKRLEDPRTINLRGRYR